MYVDSCFCHNNRSIIQKQVSIDEVWFGVFEEMQYSTTRKIRMSSFSMLCQSSGIYFNASTLLHRFQTSAHSVPRPLEYTKAKLSLFRWKPYSLCSYPIFSTLFGTVFLNPMAVAALMILPALPSKHALILQAETRAAVR